MSSTSGWKRTLGPVGVIAATLVWCVATVYLGVVGLFGAVQFVARAGRSFSTTTRCPRGHVVELYGSFRCPRCKAVREGRVFDPCGICGARSTHIDCVRCGLAVRDPLR